jgi:geranylgeranyl pyrophosphate synthase
MNRSHPQAAERSKEVFSFLDELVDGLPVGEPNKRLLRIHLDEGRRQAEELPLPSIEIPFLVAGCVGAERAFPVAAACALVYLGADLLDNVADEELPTVWLREGPARASLAATTYLGPLVTLALSRLLGVGYSANTLSEVARAMALGLAKMGSGQTDDLVSEGDESEEAAVSVAEAKTGAQLGAFAQTAALLGTNDPSVVETYADMGRSYGTAAQLATDLQDLWKQPSIDLRNGRRTLPVLHTMESLDEAAKTQFIQLLEQARELDEVHGEVRSVIRGAGTMRYMAFVVETYCQRAKRLLKSAAPTEPAGLELQNLIAAVSLFPQRTG